MDRLNLTVMDKTNLGMSVKDLIKLLLFDVIRSTTSYKDIHTQKNPLDCWIYQEIIYERKPTVIIEIGNLAGGSTVMLRDFLSNADSVGAKYVIGIDFERDRLSPKARDAKNIRWITGDARSEYVFSQVVGLISPHDRVMVIDDSSHEYIETLDILNKYAPLVTKDQYFIVEDTIYGEFIPFGEDRPRAYAAVKKFMKDNQDFKTDRDREKYFITLNPEGYLEKIR